MKLSRLLPAALAASLLAAGCSATNRDVFKPRDAAIAEIPGFPGIRVWGDGMIADAEREGFRPKTSQGGHVRYLAISGGGSSGAFGAGALAGLTKAGRRPDFDVVSGVSTGALIAPFAFLGPDYDDELEYIYTSGVTRDLFRPKPLLAGLLGSGLVGQEPLRKLIEKYADRKVMEAVAAQDRKGRRLFVVTTNMDAQRPVLWDMGKIAASRQPGALELFQDVLVASASIPAVLPPVLIDARADGRALQEMHSDGGTTVQVFTIPDGVLAEANPNLLPKGPRGDLYMLVNYTLAPEFEVVKNSTLSVGQRGLSTLMKAQTRNSVIATYGFLKQAGASFRIATIDRIVPYNPEDPFDPKYMRALFKLGYDRAVSGRLWDDSPVDDLSLPPQSATRAAASAAESRNRGAAAALGRAARVVKSGS